MHNIPCPLSEAARVRPDSTAIVTNTGSITYKEYDRRVGYAASTLDEAGVRRGNRIGILMDNCPDYPIILFALIRLGAVAAPLSTRLPAAAIPDYLSKVGANFIIADRQLPDVAGIGRIEIGGICGATDTPPVTASVVDLDQPAMIISTSGSSAEPKAALLTYGNLYYNALGSNTNIAIEPGDRWLLSLPLYHVGGLGILFRTLLAGATVVILAKDEDSATQIDKYRITHLSLVSTQLQRLVESGHRAFPNLKAILMGGSSFPGHLLQQALEMKFPLFLSYGSTEMASQITTTSLGDLPRKLETSGRLLPHRRLRISSEGEILVGGETLFAGYVNGANVDSPIDAEGWFRTGDNGHLDDDGYLVVTGRRDNLFISGGENIQPEDIESVLLSLAWVTEALVTPVPDREYGSRPVAFLQTASGMEIDSDELKRALRQRLPSFKIPDKFYPWPSGIPSAGIKLNRTEFRKLAEKLVRT